MDDHSIIEMYLARDEKAIRETQTKYGRLCHSIAYNILRNTEDAEECVNDAYLGVWNAIPPARPKSFTAFISKITRNLSLKKLEYYTRDKRSVNMTVSFSELEQILPDSEAENISEERLGELINSFLKTQKSEIRRVFVRRYYFFDSVEDIARTYSFSQSKVKSMLYQTRKKLKEYLSKEGIEI